ncbi:hypothetical protein DB30_00195 [Enhygromyxa salina]|uniref:Uncharacterized protein n=1 Tax=Enhygromyxa salina TaxID=215803 RepID=A0A0C2DAG5_9BACT|nr:hypothetical protein DB30_00195 [Enhygromyxa salina]
MTASFFVIGARSRLRFRRLWRRFDRFAPASACSTAARGGVSVTREIQAPRVA